MKFESKTCIGTPATHAWPILIDVETWPRWASSFTMLKIVSEGGLRFGSVVAIKQPKLAESSWTVSEWINGRSFAWVSRRPGMVATANHILSGQGDHCVFHQTMVLQGPVGLLTGWLGKRMINEYMQSEAQGLKREAEGTLGLAQNPPEGRS